MILSKLFPPPLTAYFSVLTSSTVACFPPAFPKHLLPSLLPSICPLRHPVYMLVLRTPEPFFLRFPSYLIGNCFLVDFSNSASGRQDTFPVAPLTFPCSPCPHSYLILICFTFILTITWAFVTYSCFITTDLRFYLISTVPSPPCPCRSIDSVHASPLPFIPLRDSTSEPSRPQRQTAPNHYLA